MIKVGLVGLPNAGKTTTFNALSGQNATVASYPFTTIETNKAIVNILDVQFEALAERLNAPDTKYGQVELWDIAGLIEGASTGSGLGNEFLGQIKDCDILLHVARAGSTIEKDRNTFLREVALFDYNLLQKPFEKNRHLSRIYPNEKEYVENDRIISKYRRLALEGRLPRESEVSGEEQAILGHLGIIGIKPIIPILNLSSESVIQVNEQKNEVKMNASTLLELGSLNRDEQELLGVDSVYIRTQLSHLFDLILSRAGFKRFYTVGHLGVGQWVAGQASNAHMCSQLLHNDFEPSMVKVASYQDILTYRSWDELQKAGKIKTLKAHKYIPSDRDVLKFIQ